MKSGPKIDQIQSLRERIADQVFETPVIRCPAVEERLGGGTEVFAKLELFQRTGTFKARGALATMQLLDAEQLAKGVTAVSAGNHAIATAFAAKAAGSSAKVVMTPSANPFRVDVCRSYGAEVIIAGSVHEAFDTAQQIQDEEGRFFVHPFEGMPIALGTGCVGLEICEQVEGFDALLVPVGGGGLISGISNAVKQLRPDAMIYGIEPVGADSMHRSFESGKPEGIDAVSTIADSLGAPFALPFSFELTRRNVDELVLVDDDQIKRSMGFLFRWMRLAVEAACAATTAAALGPLADQLRGKRVVLVFCGSNIDWQTFSSQADFDGAD